MVYINSIYTYIILYISKSLYNFKLNWVLIQNNTIKLFVQTSLKSMCLRLLNINYLVFLNFFQVVIYWYIWICCVDVINLYTFVCWTNFFFLPTDLLYICTRIVSFLFIYYIVLDLIDLKNLKNNQSYLNNIISLNIICQYFCRMASFKFLYNTNKVSLPLCFVKWTPIFKRHSYFGLWRNYRNNFFK